MCAQAQPVTPPPTTATSTAPSDRLAAGADHGSESQYELVKSRRLSRWPQPSPKALGFGGGSGQLELCEGRRQGGRVESRDASELVGARRLLGQSSEHGGPGPALPRCGAAR